MPDGPEKDAALAELAEREASLKLREDIEAERARIDAMPDGPEKDEEFEAERARIDVMPDGPAKDAALAGLAEKEETSRKLKEEFEAERTRIDAMPDGP